MCEHAVNLSTALVRRPAKDDGAECKVFSVD